MTEDDSHSIYRRSVEMSSSRRENRDLRKTFHNPHSKKSSRHIDVSGVDRVSNALYGDAARGCHHSDNGPDARKRTISINRQRLGVLNEEGPWRNRWGYRGGACRSDPDHVTPPHGTRQTNGTYRVQI